MSVTKTHYLPNGKVYKGSTHKSGSVLMTGATHTPSSKKLSHSKPNNK
jgi:hypothetical protein